MTAVGYLALSSSSLRNVILPDTLTVIKENAFTGSSISDITIPESVKIIEKDAFCNTSLSSVTIPAGVESVGRGAFSYCYHLDTITVLGNDTIIEGNLGNSVREYIVNEDNTRYQTVDGVLYDRELTTLIAYPAGRSGEFVFPESVKAIGRDAFQFCWKLDTLVIPAHVTEISNNPAADSSLEHFEVERGNPAYRSIDGVLFTSDATELVAYPTERGRYGDPYAIPITVKRIGESAFEGCDYLTSLELPAGVTEIGERAFYSCPNLESITIPLRVTRIANFAFDGGRSVNLPPLEVYYEGTEDAWNSVSIAEENFAIPAVADGVRLDSFYVPETGGNYILREANIHFGNASPAQTTATSQGETAEGLSYRLYEDHAEITGYIDGASQVVIPPELEGKPVTEIGNHAFYSCAQLSEVTLPDSLKCIGELSFWGCPSLMRITIPESVTFIGWRAIFWTVTEIHAPSGSYAAEYYADDPRLVID